MSIMSIQIVMPSLLSKQRRAVEVEYRLRHLPDLRLLLYARRGPRLVDPRDQRRPLGAGTRPRALLAHPSLPVAIIGGNR